mmetsp:Transcript_20195/g.37656  ORF Transcript_20195/g.37656 Transcript_20195/m.37656 type:complete len:310 (+) Transcript_20195:1682-2611(+)
MTDPQVQEMESLLLRYNKVAMDYLRNDLFKDCAKLLKKAANLLNSDEPLVKELPNRHKLLGFTYNNFACYHKRKRQPNVALSYLKKALEVEAKLENEVTNLAGTHLNICAIYSELGKHAEALESAQTALSLLKELQIQQEPVAGVSTLSTIVIAHHNIGAELEHLNKLEEAVAVYRSGLNFAKQFLGNQNALTESLESSFKAASRRTKAFVDMKNIRREQRDRIKKDRKLRFMRIAQLPNLRKPQSQPKAKTMQIRTRPESNLRSMNTSAIGDYTPSFTTKDRKILELSAAGTRKISSPTLKPIVRAFD